MYFFARRHFSEEAARVALVTGAFWYELVAFAHKPMTEFMATALLMSAFAFCLQSSRRESSEKKRDLGGRLGGPCGGHSVAVRAACAAGTGDGVS